VLNTFFLLCVCVCVSVYVCDTIQVQPHREKGWTEHRPKTFWTPLLVVTADNRHRIYPQSTVDINLSSPPLPSSHAHAHTCPPLTEFSRVQQRRPDEAPLRHPPFVRIDFRFNTDRNQTSVVPDVKARAAQSRSAIVHLCRTYTAAAASSSWPRSRRAANTHLRPLCCGLRLGGLPAAPFSPC
jgi:hypothetical protein